MAKQKKNVPFIECLLVGVIVAGAAGLGFYVFSQKDKANATLEATQQTEPVMTQKNTTTKKVSADPAANWTNYKAPSGHYSIRIPDGWVLSRVLNSDNLASFTTDNMAVDAGVPGKVSQTSGGKDGTYGLFLNYGEDASNVKPEGKQADQFITDNGLTVTKFQYTQPIGSQPAQKIATLQSGDRVYNYFINDSSVQLAVTYSVDATKTDNFKTVEAFVRSFKKL